MLLQFIYNNSLDCRKIMIVKKGFETYFCIANFVWNFSDKRESHCYLTVEEIQGRNRCSMDTGSPLTKAACCCSIGRAWGTYCEVCPPHNSNEYKSLCPSGPGYKPNTITVRWLSFFLYNLISLFQNSCEYFLLKRLSFFN